LHPQPLGANRTIAARLGITGVPTFLIGNRILVGAVSAETMMEAARKALREPWSLRRGDEKF